MVKFQIASDLHIETFNGYPKCLDYITPSSDILILAGDIGNVIDRTKLELFLIDVCKNFKVVFYVAGNNEYYKSNKSNKLFTKQEIDLELNNMIKTINKRTDCCDIYLLNNRSTGIIIDDVLVIGCTLWSYSQSKIPPFIVRIHGMDKKLYNNLYYNDRKYIEQMIKYSNANKLKLLVITHHLPSYSLLGIKHQKDRFKSLYASNLDNLLSKERVHTWVSGHNHCNFDKVSRNGTRLVSNQKGKIKDNIIDYRKNKIIIV